MTSRQQLKALLGVLKTRTRIANKLREPLYSVSRWASGRCKPHPRAAKKITALYDRTFAASAMPAKQPSQGTATV